MLNMRQNLLRRVWSGCLALWIVMMLGCATVPPERQAQKAFTTPEKAVATLVSAVKESDTKELFDILGPEAEGILFSGDPVADRSNREVFVVSTEQAWSLLAVDNKTRELIIGYEDWPFPIPLVKDPDGWRFDTAAGKIEVLARRIGRNELAVISVLRTYVTAQRQYAADGHDGNPAGVYAQKVRSTPGRHDGLYWETTSPSEPANPLSEFAAQVQHEGYSTAATSQPRPYRGYYFRILTAQGEAAPGGAKSYISNGLMRDGFAMIAWPAEYDNSGVMSFIVSHDGIIHEADLGPDTAQVADAVRAYNPDSAWSAVE